LLIEKKKEVGRPVHCAEYVPAALGREIPIPPEAIAQRVEAMVTHIQWDSATDTKVPGVILHRDRFDRYLAERAGESGAQLHTGCRVIRLHKRFADYLHEGRCRRVRFRYLIGADGPVSLTGRSSGVRNEAFVSGLQVELPTNHMLSRTEVYFLPEFTAGYGWVFPKGASANVGVGVRHTSKVRLSKLLSGFVQGLVDKGTVRARPVLKRTGGLIPVGGPLSMTAVGNRLLCGDAAGQTDPITGGGIPAAIACGRLAGKSAAAAFRTGRDREISTYEEAWRELYAEVFERAVRKRRVQERDWSRGSFRHLIQETWIAFEEFYRR
jgi:geranylgeranyl reductase family protein